MAVRCLPDPEMRWDLDTFGPEHPVELCTDLRRLHPTAPERAIHAARYIAQRTTATVLFLLREEPAEVEAHARWSAGLGAWRARRVYVRRVVRGCEAAIDERARAVARIALRRAA